MRAMKKQMKVHIKGIECPVFYIITIVFPQKYQQVITHFSKAPDSGYSNFDVLISIQNAKSAAVIAREGASAASIDAHKAFITARKSSIAARVLLQKAIILVNALEAAQEAHDKRTCESWPATV